MRQILNLLVFGILMTNTLNTFAQTDKMDFVFDWQNNQENLWISIDSSYHKFTPTIDEIKQAKELSIKYTDSLELLRDPKTSKQFGKILKYNHTDYNRQYVGYIDKNGERIIFINACCSASGNNKNMNQNWIFVLDGGSCYFHIKIDLKTKKCFDFSVNGEA